MTQKSKERRLNGVKSRLSRFFQVIKQSYVKLSTAKTGIIILAVIQGSEADSLTTFALESVFYSDLVDES